MRAFHLFSLIAVVATPASAIVTYEQPDEYEFSSGIGIAAIVTKFERRDSRCTGALIEGNAIVTAAHCFDELPHRGNLISTTVSFDGSSTGITVFERDIEIEETWTGDLFASPADIATVRLPKNATINAAPFVLPRSELSYRPVGIRLAGYGDAGQGSVDKALTPPFDDPRPLRVGFNHYDEALPGADEFWNDWYLYDFDDFTTPNNVIGEPGWITLPDGTLAITELDYDFDGTVVFGESMIARGDSGGPSYFDNVLVGIHSWVSAEPDFGVEGQDGIYLPALGPDDVGFGWVGADVPVARYADWIRQAAAGPLDPPSPVPAPPAAALLITGVVLLVARRRR
jgi:hypothetical protein